MSHARKRRRWLTWDRWIDRCAQLSPETVATRGALKAINQRVRDNRRRAARRMAREWKWVDHEPRWEPTLLPTDAEGNTAPGFHCTHELENGNGPCGGNVFRLEDAVGSHSCYVNLED